MSQQQLSPEFKDMLRMVRDYRANPFEMTPEQASAMRMMMALADTYDRWYNNLGAEEEAMERRRRNTLSSAIPDLFDPQTPTRRTQSEAMIVDEDDEVPPPRTLVRPTRLNFSDETEEDSIESSASSEDPTFCDRHLVGSIPFVCSSPTLDAPIPIVFEETSTPSFAVAPTTPRSQSPSGLRIPLRVSRRYTRPQLRIQEQESEDGSSSDSSCSSTPRPQESPRRRPAGDRLPRRLRFESSEEDTTKRHTEETSEEQSHREGQQQ